MTLSDYLSEHGLTYEAFGALIGADRKTVWRYAQGLSIPRRGRMRRIEAATGGAVGPADFFDAAGGAQGSEGAAA